ncbi:MAG: 2-hydroxyacyl-CoA dehydratase [Desulfobacter sp.]|nr:MAG: 2-hydroxyacyl-CoA dehydratase [Desulfobacter sp.]
MTPSPRPSRRERLLKRIRTEMDQECRAVAESLDPADRTGLAPFLERLTQSSTDLRERTAGALAPKIFSLCVQAPPELFHAAGIGHSRLACGSFATADTAPRHLPALACPMAKSMAGLLAMAGEAQDLSLVVPTTCDWMVKFPELAGFRETAPIHFMELPHLREGEAAARRWTGAVKELKTWVEKRTGRRIRPKALLSAVREFNRAAPSFERLLSLRRTQALPAAHFALIMNAFSLMDINAWHQALLDYMAGSRAPAETRPPVFLTGSPIVFPNYKMLDLIENAGMHIAGDDICTMERVFPGLTAPRDNSEYSLIKALADRHHRACTCPTFADNARRMNRLVAQVRQNKIRGVVFHVLKGCHPFDMEAGLAEERLKAEGIRFLKIETDYVKSDEQNIVTRLEAFGRSIAAGPETAAENRTIETALN